MWSVRRVPRHSAVSVSLSRMSSASPRPSRANPKWLVQRPVGIVPDQPPKEYVCPIFFEASIGPVEAGAAIWSKCGVQPVTELSSCLIPTCDEPETLTRAMATSGTG